MNLTNRTVLAPLGSLLFGIALVEAYPAPADAHCGNGVIEEGEECEVNADEEYIFGGRTCASEFSVSCGTLSCRREGGSTLTCLIDRDISCGGFCGDACTRGTEECDEGGDNCDSCPDACRTDCVLPRCGDEGVDTGEECDDYWRNSDYMPDACRTDCTNPSCGDGVIDVGHGEQCDLGPLNSDAAGSACTTHCVAPRCGNGTIEAGETCDDNNRTETDSCTNACIPNVCGDGLVNTTGIGPLLLPIERCDDGNNDDGDECRYDCYEDLTLCGNGRIDVGEDCDEGTANSDAPDAACRPDCRPLRCGDGVTDPGADPPEACDGDPGCLSTCARPY